MVVSTGSGPSFGANTLQTGYEGSPEIITNATDGCFTIQGGTGDDTDDNFCGENNAGTQTYSIQADGEVFASRMRIGPNAADNLFTASVTSGGATMSFESGANDWIQLFATSGADPALIWSSNKDLRFGTTTTNTLGGFVERARITNDGLWGIGTNLTTPTARIHTVVLDTENQVSGRFVNNDTTNDPDTVIITNTTTGDSLQINTTDLVVAGDGHTTFGKAHNWARTATAVSANTAGEMIVGVTDTSIARTITLDTDDVVDGRVIVIKDESGVAGTNNITIATEGAETIDGAATIVISSNFGVARVYSNGSNWFVI